MIPLLANFRANWRRFFWGGGTILAWLLGSGWNLLPAAERPATNAPQQLLRFGYTAGLFTPGYNENDVRAAMKVWIQSIVQNRHLGVDSNLYVFPSVTAMVQTAAAEPLDGYGLLAPEYNELRQSVAFDQVALSVRDGRYTQAYVLLVRKDSGWDKIDQLRSHNLVVLQTPRMSLAFTWLDVLLAQNHLPAAADFFDRVTSNSKPAQVGLPVFFHKADACVLTRQSYDVLAELNPQLRLQLRVLAESPELVPSFIVFRADHPLPQREQVFQEIRDLHDTPAGQQVLALFQTEGFVIKPVSCLAPTLELIATHQQLCGETNQSPGPAAPVIAQHSQPPS